MSLKVSRDFFYNTLKIRSTEKHGQKNSVDRRIKEHCFSEEPKTDQWNWFTVEIIFDAQTKDFTRERTQIFKSVSTNFNPFDNANNFDFPKLKLENKFAFDYHH